MLSLQPAWKDLKIILSTSFPGGVPHVAIPFPQLVTLAPIRTDWLTIECVYDQLIVHLWAVNAGLTSCIGILLTYKILETFREALMEGLT